MMQAMFSDDFKESSARVVKFPGVNWCDKHCDDGTCNVSCKYFQFVV